MYSCCSSVFGSSERLYCLSLLVFKCVMSWQRPPQLIQVVSSVWTVSQASTWTRLCAVQLQVETCWWRCLGELADSCGKQG